MDENFSELALQGGQMTPGVVRVANTVRRPLKVGEDVELRHQLLRLLQEHQFKYAPKFLGIDDQNREILSFIPGEAAHGSTKISLDSLSQVAQALKQFHDITAGSSLAQSHEVVCHNDIAPWNTIFGIDGELAGFIDFDAAAPGQRLDDLGYMIWTFLNLGSNLDSPTLQKSITAIYENYELSSSNGIVDAVLRQQKRVLEWRSRMALQSDDLKLRQFSAERVGQIKQQIDWVELNGRLLEA